MQDSPCPAAFETQLCWTLHVPCVACMQDTFKPPCSNIALADNRINPFHTSYSSDFHAPFEAHGQLRSPMRNKDLAATQTSLKEHYASSYNRVGE